MLVLTFWVGDDCLALDVRQVREVVPRVPLRRSPGSAPWLAGLFIYRGQVVPVIDLHRLAGDGECPAHLSSRIILVPRRQHGRESLIGLLAAQVADLQEIQAPSQPLAGPAEPGQPDLGPVIVTGGGILHLVELDRLLPESARQQLAGAPVELPP
ncbi:MAG TPA: chemotaxis protein CheW [Gemmataceae bacterium]|jgi:chemotaxis-related protein WspB|nr:chemotaxis protein CheW [Gemmataceae bacterium]